MILFDRENLANENTKDVHEQASWQTSQFQYTFGKYKFQLGLFQLQVYMHACISNQYKLI